MDVNEPRLEVFVHCELTLNELKTWAMPGITNQRIVSFNKMRQNFLHFGEGLLHKIVFLSVSYLQIALKWVKVDLIARLILSKLFICYLDWLCGHMGKFVIDLCHIEWLCSCADDSLSMKVDINLLFLYKGLCTKRTTKAKALISNFLLLKRKGFEIYFWMRNLLPFLHYFSTCCLISLYVVKILLVIKVFYPSLVLNCFTIQYFLLMLTSQLSILLIYNLSK